MSKSRQDIQFKTIAILVGGDVGQTPSAEDADTVNGYIDSAVSTLGGKKAVYISDPDELDDGLFMPFCEYVANMAADEFGGAYDPQKALVFENEIRRVAAATPGYGPQSVEFF